MQQIINIKSSGKLKFISSRDLKSAQFSFGGKADGLLFLCSNGFYVPEFFILDNAIINEIKKDTKQLDLFINVWINENKIDSSSLWAIRSSADVEDGKEKSFAGLFRTELNCNTDKIAAAILYVIEGFEKFASANYQRGESSGVNIIIQKMIDPQFSGVGFSIDPMNGNDKSVLLNLIPGLGSKLVSGEKNALVARIINGSVKFEFDEEEISGTFYNGNETDKNISIENFKKDVTPFIDELRQGLISLQKLKGFPVDVEFAVANGKINWLQVRPITKMVANQKPDFIWDNSNISSNFPGVSLPLTISFTGYSYQKVYCEMCKLLGGTNSFITKNQKLFGNMSRGIKGGLYYNVTAWQQLLWQMPFGKKTSAMITKMWGAADAEFEKPGRGFTPIIYLRLFFNVIFAFISYKKHKRKYLQTFQEVEKNFSLRDLKNFNEAELIETYKEIDSKLGENWNAPMLNGFYTMVSFSLLRKTLKKSIITKDQPNFINDILFNTGDVISVTIVLEMQAIIKTINDDAILKKLFSEKSAGEIWNELDAVNLEFKQRIEKYISDYGDRAEEGELNFETVNYKEDPLLFIQFLSKNLSAGSGKKDSVKKFDYRALIRKYYRFNIFKRWYLLWLTRITIERVRDRENMRFIRTKTFGMLRTIFRAIDARLLGEGKIEQPKDSFYLTFEELINQKREEEFKKIISDRKKIYLSFGSSEMPVRYHQVGEEFIPVATEVDFTSGIKGVGCCSGEVTAEVVVIDQENIYTTNPDGKILVARYFEPGWIGLFSRAAGLISERGSLLSHTAILCRELGKPSIVAVKGALQKIKPGSRVHMNGANGKIEIIGNE